MNEWQPVEITPERIEAWTREAELRVMQRYESEIGQQKGYENGKYGWEAYTIAGVWALTMLMIVVKFLTR